jgi:hypothetical protein
LGLQAKDWGILFSTLLYLFPSGRCLLRNPDSFLSGFTILCALRRLKSRRDFSCKSTPEATCFLKQCINESFLEKPPDFEPERGKHVDKYIDYPSWGNWALSENQHGTQRDHGGDQKGTE